MFMTYYVRGSCEATDRHGHLPQWPSLVNLPRPLLLTLLTLFTAATWWLAARNQRDREPVPTSTPQPGYYIKQAQFVDTGLSGKIILRGRALSASQIRQTGGIELLAPEIEYHIQPSTIWRVSSKKSTLPAKTETMIFEGDVKLSASHARGAVAHTEHLTLDMTHSLARSSDKVSIDLPPHTVTAVGFLADLSRETFSLESKVNGTFTR